MANAKTEPSKSEAASTKTLNDPPLDEQPKAEKSEIKEGELLRVATVLKEAAKDISVEVHEIRSVFHGPIPPPELLTAYDNTLPGLSDRIVSMAEEEGKHRRDIEKMAMEAEIEVTKLLSGSLAKEVDRGQKYALAIAIITVITGGVIAAMGAQWPGALIGVSGLAGIVTTFIRGREGSDDTDDTE